MYIVMVIKVKKVCQKKRQILGTQKRISLIEREKNIDAGIIKAKNSDKCDKLCAIVTKLSSPDTDCPNISDPDP